MRKDNGTVPSPIMIALRPATIEDATIVFEWRNADDVRAISESKKELTIRRHMKWFAERLLLTHPESIWMVTSLTNIDGSEGVSVGAVRILLDGKHYARISVVIASKHRGRGIGRQAIKLIAEKVRGMKRIAVARVHVTNLVSQRAFIACGFHVVIDNLENSFIELQAS